MSDLDFFNIGRLKETVLKQFALIAIPDRMSGPTQRVLLIGGHGKVAQFFTRFALDRSWQLTSVIRNPDQKPTIEALGTNRPGKLDILISSVEEVKTKAQAQEIITSASPSYVVWSAGAGGQGGPERTDAVDRAACINFIEAAVATNSVKKFLLVSYLGSRRKRAPWWSDEDWQQTQEVNDGVLKNYYPAKLAADEALVSISKQRSSDFAAICLRPGTLSDSEEEGKISLGKTAARGKVARIDVARVAAELLDAPNVKSSWLDLLQGGEDSISAVNRALSEGVDAIEGENAA